MSSAISQKDPNLAVMIEIVAGYFGFLGIGYIYAGRTAAGIARLLGFWLYITLLLIITLTGSTAPFVSAVLSPLSPSNTSVNRLSLLLIMLSCLFLLPLPFVPIISGLRLKRLLKG